ncbi:hypothetical protein [Streptomyces sp. NPDC006012]|uniref:hypothetical protein n=1 Tax=Streptomyces sp. NPDC006012 TaxID=3364739 RepID=UPI00369F515A
MASRHLSPPLWPLLPPPRATRPSRPAQAPGDPAPTAASLETEASGYALVELKNTGDAVTLRNSTGQDANTLVVRASIPDPPQGGGITASLNLYVNGTFRQAIPLSCRQEWNYRGATTDPDDPDAGRAPYHFYNEFPSGSRGAPSPRAARSRSRRTPPTRPPSTTSTPSTWTRCGPRGPSRPVPSPSSATGLIRPSRRIRPSPSRAR